MKRTSIKTVERFKHEGERYKRESKSGASVTWKYYNTGWGEHGWLPLKNSGSERVKTVEEMEKLYQSHPPGVGPDEFDGVA